MLEGAALLIETVRGLVDNTIKEIPQDTITESLVHAPKIFKEDMCIHWGLDCLSILNLIRGLSPYPAAFTELDAKNLKIYTASSQIEIHQAVLGSFDTDHKTYLRFAAKDGWISVLELQLEGKKRMDVVSFLRGFRSAPNSN
jgi:methionyl-tRNA formyltransferase